MFFPIIKGTLFSKESKNSFMGQIIYLIQNNTSVKVRINQISSNEVVFQTHSMYWLQRNSFLPNIRVVMSNTETGTVANVEYLLQKGTKIFVIVYCTLALAFEVMLLSVCNQMNNRLILLLPFGLIFFAMAMCFCGFLLSSQKIHHEILNVCDGGERLKIVFIEAEKSLANRQH